MKRIFTLSILFMLTISLSVFGQPSLDGATSSVGTRNVSYVNVSHTTGTGLNRLMLVGISANSYNGRRTISSVTFTPSGGR